MLLIRRQNAKDTPIQPRFEDPCGATLNGIIWPEIGAVDCRKGHEGPGADGERLRLGKGELGQREI